MSAGRISGADVAVQLSTGTDSGWFYDWAREGITCPACGGERDLRWANGGGGFTSYRFDCPRCGEDGSDAGRG